MASGSSSRTVLVWLPKTARLHRGPPGALAQIWNAEDREQARRAVAAFKLAYGAKFAKAVAKVTDDLDELLAFYDYPAEHWVHVRTTNPIESTFATVRHRTKVTKGPGSKAAGLAMAFKLIEGAQARWRAVNAAARRPGPRRRPRRTRPPRRTTQPRSRRHHHRSRLIKDFWHTPRRFGRDEAVVGACQTLGAACPPIRPDAESRVARTLPYSPVRSLLTSQPDTMEAWTAATAQASIAGPWGNVGGSPS
jgi:hypothetical protein